MFRQGICGAIFGLALLPQVYAALKPELVASGFARPVFAISPSADTNRLFIVEQHSGRIRIIDLSSNTVKATPFLVVTNLATGNEQGLLGLAFHPGYATNGYFYINQTSRGGTAGRTEISRYQAAGDPQTSDSADPSTRKVILDFDQPQVNHNGGWTAFGPDGYLYISTGDGGGGYDQHGTPGNGQSRNTLLGKILRIDVDHGDPYAIPDGNPYKASLSLRNEIWAFGLRNPWRCSFDRLTGDLWIGDVGQDTREEIDLNPAGVSGLNFGWRPREGSIQDPLPAYAKETPVTPAVDPVFDYPHPTGNSVTGGYVYRGARIVSLQGKYLFADYVSGKFWELTPSGTNGSVREITAELNPAPKQIGGPSSFGEDAAGEIYICDLADGQIFRITSTAPSALKLTAERASSGELEITFNAVAAQSYVLESADAFSMQSSDWTTVTNVAAGAARAVTLTHPVTEARRYFRVRTP